MVGKIDLVMWAKNGEAFLPTVLKRIDEVIPHENVCHKILVDDHSTDRTIEIAKSFNWDIYPNPRGGVPSGANEALRHVDCAFFVSVEQDVVLAKDWWERIPPYMNYDKVAVAQGINRSTEPTLRKLDEYVHSRLKPSVDNPILFGVSIDNNIFRTKVIRQLGGFPNDCPVCADTILVKKIVYETPYKWIVNTNVVSDHIRQSIKAYIKHAYTLSKLCARTPYCANEAAQPPISMLRLFLTSPMRALIVAYKKRCPKLLYVYPAIRYQRLKASIEATVKRKISY
jgi:glycosyltransferase involved in cell wall biosynthesis